MRMRICEKRGRKTNRRRRQRNSAKRTRQRKRQETAWEKKVKETKEKGDVLTKVTRTADNGTKMEYYE